MTSEKKKVEPDKIRLYFALKGFKGMCLQELEMTAFCIENAAKEYLCSDENLVIMTVSTFELLKKHIKEEE